MQRKEKDENKESTGWSGGVGEDATPPVPTPRRWRDRMAVFTHLLYDLCNYRFITYSSETTSPHNPPFPFCLQTRVSATPSRGVLMPFNVSNRTSWQVKKNAFSIQVR